MPVIYAAQSQSLAALEILVHLDSTELLEKYVLIEITTEEALILRLEHGKLPRNWNKNPSPASLKAIGDSWAREGSSVALRVSSALVPGEDNFLFNPAHSDFQKVRIGKPLTFRFDPRLTSKP